MSATYFIVGAAVVVAGYAAWKYIMSSPAPPEQHKNSTPPVQPQTTPKDKPGTPADASTNTAPKTHTVPSGAVDNPRLNSIVAYWRSTHPNATQAEIDEEYRVELWNNTNTNK